MGKKKKASWGGQRKGSGRKREVANGCSLMFWLPSRVRKRLDAEAEKNGETVSTLARRILEGARPDLPWNGTTGQERKGES